MTMGQIDWDNLDHSFPYRAAMAECVQDPIFHAEGDVWTHTKMVLDRLPHDLRLAGLYHDVCKPETRTVEYDEELGRERIGHPHHARKGAQVAWHDLWLQGLDLETRLKVYWIILWHQRVFHLWSYRDMVRMALQFACVACWDDLITFAKADNAGRIAPDQQGTEDTLSLLGEWLHEERISAKRFATDHHRFTYLRTPGRALDYVPQPAGGSRVIMLSGLPGSGKDTYVRTHLAGLPVVSLDAIRETLGIDPEDNQGRVRQAGLEQARVFLRTKTDFVWNSTGLTRELRGRHVALFRDYDAHVSIHALDRPLSTVLRQNRERGLNLVPEKVILDLARKWEPPSVLEAHEVNWV